MADLRVLQPNEFLRNETEDGRSVWQLQTLLNRRCAKRALQACGSKDSL